MLGETPVWLDGHDCVAFIDGPRGDILRFWPADGRRERKHVAAELGFLAHGTDSPLVCGSGLSIHPASSAGALNGTPVTVPGDPARLRLNDAHVDSRGVLWTGSMDRSGTTPLGALFRVGADGVCEQFDDGYTIPNGFALSRAGRLLYVADSPQGVVHAYAVDTHGRAGHRREWLRVDRNAGFPDGMAIDVDDHVWIAFYGGACVRRYRPDATLEREIRLPTPNVTACVFGGAARDVLYVTTAAADRHAGWRGLLARHYGGALFSCEAQLTGTSGVLPVSAIR